ncbi:hypothetical protein Tco_0471191 [Tanacetum coccineum]
MIAIRINKFQKKTGRKLQLDAKNLFVLITLKVECYKCHKTGAFCKECSTKEEIEGRDDGIAGDTGKGEELEIRDEQHN